jgi:hypothetical protein
VREEAAECGFDAGDGKQVVADQSGVQTGGGKASGQTGFRDAGQPGGLRVIAR